MRAPEFTDQDPDMDGVQNALALRMVGENAEAGDPVGDPVKALDANGDILTYTISARPRVMSPTEGCVLQD